MQPTELVRKGGGGGGGGKQGEELPSCDISLGEREKQLHDQIFCHRNK